MLTPEPLEMKPHVYCTRRGAGGGGWASKSDSWSHLSINWRFRSFPFFVSFYFIKHHFTEIPGFIVVVFFFFVSWGARVPVGPKAIEEKRLEEPGSD